MEIASTLAQMCPRCGGWIPGYVLYDKEVVEQLLLPWDKECRCGVWEVVRDVMLSVYSSSRETALLMFRNAASRLGLLVVD